MKTRSWAVLTLPLCSLLVGCQAPYILKSAWSQADLLMSRKSLEKVMAASEQTGEAASESDRSKPGDRTTVTKAERAKLQLAIDAKKFGEAELGLKKNSNYDSYVKLDRPYVSYVVSAAKKDRLEPHLWSFPIIGAVPYKGFFNPDDAKAEAESLREKGFDTYVRGVSAYSTLGWFDDPILSSMLRYSDYDLVNTIIHESVHATLYIKSQADFNERLATYIGNIGADLFFARRDGDQSPTLAQARSESEDDKLFSEFISSEIDTLKAWYAESDTSAANGTADASPSKGKTAAAPSAEFLELRAKKFTEIRERFDSKIKPHLKSERYVKSLTQSLSLENLNNARLLAWKLYVYDLSDFDRVYTALGRDPRKLIEFAKSLEKEKDAEAALKSFGR